MERRDFMKFMVLISAAFTAGQFWIVAENWLRRRRGQPALTRIASVDDVPVGGAVRFVYPGEHDDCLLLRPEPDRPRRLQPEMHAPVLRGTAAAGTRAHLLPVS